MKDNSWSFVEDRPRFFPCSLLGELTDIGRKVCLLSINRVAWKLSVTIQSTHNLGTALRALYVEKYVSFCLIMNASDRYHRLNFLPDIVQNDSEVYFRLIGNDLKSVEQSLILLHRSTNVPRTIESLQQVVHGLYPPSKRAEGFVSKIRTRYAHFIPSFGDPGV